MSGKVKKLTIVFTCIIIAASLVWYFFFRQTYDKNGLPNPLVSLEYVSSRPEAKLFYPYGSVVSRIGLPQENTESGLGVAFAGAIMTTGDSPDKVYQWYHDWLLAHGWHRDDNMVGGLVMTQTSIQAYTRGEKREVFYVAMDNHKFLGWTIGKQLPSNVTIFEFRYAIR